MSAAGHQRSAIGRGGGSAHRQSAPRSEPAPGGASWLRRIAAFVLAALAGLLWACVLAWLIGRIATDRFAWSQWLWWIPTPIALAVAGLGFLLALRPALREPRRRVRRRRLMLWLACIVVMFGWFGLVEHRLLRRAPPIPPAGSALTIAHWNMDLANQTPPDELVRHIDALDADVLVLTVPPGEVRSLLSERAAAPATGEHVLSVWPMFVRSRLPIMNVRTLVAADHVYITRVELDATVTLGRVITIDVVDMPSNPRRPRMALARETRRLLDEVAHRRASAAGEAGGGDSRTPSGAPAGEASGGARVDLAIGDFNITRGSASLTALMPGMRHAYETAGHGYGATFPRRVPLYHIDHMLVNRASDLRAARYGLIDPGSSRHRAQKVWIVKK